MTAPIVASVILQQTEPRFFNYNEGRKRIVAKKKKGKNLTSREEQTTNIPALPKEQEFSFHAQHHQNKND